MLEGHLDLRWGRGRRPPEELAGAALVLGELGHAVVSEELGGEVVVLLGHHGLEVLLQLHRVELAHALVLSRDHDVDAVGVITDVVVDPVQLGGELLGAEAHGSQHPEPPGLADGGHDVPAVGEGEDGELDIQTVTDLGVHGADDTSGRSALEHVLWACPPTSGPST